jgi:surface antigen
MPPAKLFAAVAACSLIASTVAAQTSPAQTSPAQSAASAPATSQPAFLPGVFGCTASGGKQEVAAVIGGVIGGYAGSRISRDNRTLGTVLGAALGAGAGAWLGCQMQKSDLEKAQAAAEKAIAEGRNQTWTNAETGSSGSVTVTSAAAPVAPALAGVRFASGVTPEPAFAAQSGGSYVATGAANLRGGASTASPVIGRLTRGQDVEVAALVAGKPWALVRQGDVATGYVATSLLRARPAPARTQTAAANAPAGLDANGCRMVTEQVTLRDSGTTTTQYKACRMADGAWELTRV